MSARFSRRAGEARKGATYAGSIYRYKRPASRLGYFIAIGLLAWALSMAWWFK